MDLTSLYYFTELSKDLHITRTANRLYISQQTLSNHVLRLEEYYGTALLERKPKLRLTRAGEFVLAFAQTMVRENENLRGVLFDVAHQDWGILRVGASQPRANICFPEVFPTFFAQYPNVELRVTTSVSSQTEPKVLSGDLDFGVVLAGDANPQLIAESLLKEKVYLCVSDGLLRRYYGEESAALKEKAAREGAHIRDFSKLPFGMFSNRMGNDIREEFHRTGVIPNTHMTSYYSDMQLSLCVQGVMACFVPHMVLASRLDRVGADINVFMLYRDESPMLRELVLIRRRDMYLPHYAKYFMELLTGYFAGLQDVQLVRAAYSQAGGEPSPR